MILQVIHNPAEGQHSGFTQAQFRKLDQLYCAAATRGVMPYRSVECDFDDGIASYTYYLSGQSVPYLQFVIRRVGPRNTLYEVFKMGKGLILKSGIFDRAFEGLHGEVNALLNRAC